MKYSFIAAIVLCVGIVGEAAAGDKRFCGYITENGSGSSTLNLGAGAWFNKNSSEYTFGGCGTAVDKAKSGLKKKTLNNGKSAWESFDWKKKEGYKCGSASDPFTGSTNMCKKYMKEGKGYYIEKKGTATATFTRT